MTLNLNFVITNLDGNPIKEDGTEILAGKVIANILVRDTGNSIKFYDWGIQLYKDGVIEIDNADKKMLSKFIEDHKILSNLVKGQVLKVMDKLKE